MPITNAGARLDLEAQAWIRQLNNNQLASRMSHEMFGEVLPEIKSYQQWARSKAPKFTGRMASLFLRRKSRSRNFTNPTVFDVVSEAVEDERDSLDASTAPFDVGWGKQDGFRRHKVWAAVPSGASAKTRGRVRSNLLAWLAANVDSGYASVAGVQDADQVLRILREQSLSPWITVRGHATEWAFSDVMLTRFADRIADAVFDGFATAWEANALG